MAPADRGTMLTMNKAKSLASDCVCRMTGCTRDDLHVIDALTQCRRSGWIFFYEARGPVVVTHRGDVHPLDGDRPADDVLKEFEQSVAARRKRA